MRPKNLTPFRFAATLTSTKPPSPQASLVVRGKFALVQDGPVRALEDDLGLAQGALSGERFAEGDDARQGECLYPGDFAGWKLRADVMLRGHCFAPRGEPVRELPIALRVGKLQKALLAVGPRVWLPGVLGDKPSEPAPFKKMLVGLSTAFGGAGYPANPAGKGLGDGDAVELPNVEDVRARVSSRGDRPPPATFAPIPSGYAARTRLLGSYGADYAKRRPFYPADFDGSAFQAAPPDQQVEGFLRGDEEVTLTNLHPEHPVLRTRLPGLRVRAFVDDVAKRAREVPLLLDTLFIDTDEGALYLTWRGLTNVQDIELRDLQFALVVSEPLPQPPRPEPEHLATLLAFEADPVGLEEAKRVAQRKLADVAGELPDPPGAPGPLRSDGGAASKVIGERLGDLAPALADKLEKLAAAASRPLPKEAKAPSEANPAQTLDAAVEAARKQDKPPTGGGQRRAAAQRIDAAVAALADARDRAAKKGADPKVLEALDKPLADPRLAALRAEATRSKAPADDELVPGAKLSGRNLAELSLSGRRLDGADLSGADLSRADLRGASLRGADLSGAMLAHAVLDDADLEGADLTAALAIEASLQGANLQRAKLVRTTLVRADLSRADLREARCSFALLAKARFRDARCDGAAFVDCALLDAELAGASFAGADLTGCLLQGVKAAGVDFGGARLERANFLEAELEGARFNGAKGTLASFFRARCLRADFRRAVLPKVRFAEASAEQARFFGADLRGGLFHLAKLGGASFRDANLFEADLGRAELSRTSLRNANCYGASFVGAAGEATDLIGANLTFSTLRR